MLPAVIEPGGGDIGVSKPLLDFGNIRLMIEGIGGDGDTKRMHPQAFDAGQADLLGLDLPELIGPTARKLRPDLTRNIATPASFPLAFGPGNSCRK